MSMLVGSTLIQNGTNVEIRTNLFRSYSEQAKILLENWYAADYYLPGSVFFNYCLP